MNKSSEIFEACKL